MINLFILQIYIKSRKQQGFYINYFVSLQKVEMYMERQISKQHLSEAITWLRFPLYS